MTIERLYLERLPSGGYDVVCNDLVTTISKPQETFPGWLERMTGIASAIEVLTQPIADELEDEDDIAGARVGYQPLGLVRVQYAGEWRCVPEFMLPGTIMRLYAGGGG